MILMERDALQCWPSYNSLISLILSSRLIKWRKIALSELGSAEIEKENAGKKSFLVRCGWNTRRPSSSFTDLISLRFTADWLLVSSPRNLIELCSSIQFMCSDDYFKTSILLANKIIIIGDRENPPQHISEANKKIPNEEIA